MKNDKKDEVLNMVNDDQLKEAYDKLSVAMVPLLEILSKQQVKFVDALIPLTEAIGENQSQLSKSMLTFSEVFGTYLEKYNELMAPMYESIFRISEGLARFKRMCEYLDILSENLWPIHFYEENDFIEYIFKNKNDIDAAIINYFSFNKLEAIKIFLLGKNSERTEIIKEAFEDYYNKKYYSCVSLLICQIDDLLLSEGVESKFNEVKQKVEANLSIIINEINQRYQTDYNEKKLHSRLKLLIATHENEFLPQIHFLKIITKIYKSTDSIAKWETLPYRNKICHGKQVNFGTRSHALKTIFLVYGLIIINNFYEVV